MGYKYTLDEYFFLGKKQIEVFGCVSADFLAKIVRDHGNLCYSLAKKYGKTLHSDEALGYFFESLPIAISEFNPCKGKAGTALTLVFCRLMSRRNEQNKYIGGVRVPLRNEKFSSMDVMNMTEEDLHEALCEVCDD